MTYFNVGRKAVNRKIVNNEGEIKMFPDKTIKGRLALQKFFRLK